MAKTNRTELNKLLDQVVLDVTEILAKADEEEVSLAKASPGEEAPGEETPAGSSVEGSDGGESGEVGGAEGAEESPGEQHAGSPAEEGSPEGTEVAPEGAEGAEQNPATDESGGPEALVAEYAKMPPEELKLHLMAAHEALMQVMGESGEGSEGAPEGGDPGPAEGVSPEGTAPAGVSAGPVQKKEIKTDGNGGQIMKSEVDTRISSLEKSLKEKDEEVKELTKKVNEAAASLQRFFSTPMRKSVTSISDVGFVGKPGSVGTEEIKLSKSEVIEKLNNITQSDIKKSDREAINKYVIGAAPISTVAHLLK